MSTPPRYNLEVGSSLSPFNPIPAAQCFLLTQNKSESEDAGGTGVAFDGVQRRRPNPGSDLRSKFFREARGVAGDTRGGCSAEEADASAAQWFGAK